jgi:sugar-specific transcriptional regulator TrmB
VKTREKILDYVRKKPMATAKEISTGLGINHDTIVATLNTLKRKGKVKEADSWPVKYVILPKKPIKVNDQDFVDYVQKLDRELHELREENNRLRNELSECRGKLARLAQRIVRQEIYGE